MPSDYALAAAALAFAAALCGLAAGAVRRALGDGLRCLARYPALWRIPALFATSYAAFELLAEALLHLRMQDFSAWILSAGWSPAPSPLALLFGNIPAAASRSASIFTIFVATFPLSALFAAMLLANSHGLLGEMFRALRRRLGNVAGIALGVLVVVTALCAIAKPPVYLFHPEIAERVPFAAELAVDLVSTVFEMLLGIFLLTCLMLTTYAWRRGMAFDRTKLLHVAMRRSGFVLKWSLLLAALALLLVQLPLQAATLLAPGSAIDTAAAWFATTAGPLVVTVFVLLFCPVQAILVFHNESLREALRESRRLLRAHAPRILAFLGVCFPLFLLVLGTSGFLASRLGAETSAALVVRIAAAGIEGVLAGWLIASWTCLYKGLSAGRKEVSF